MQFNSLAFFVLVAVTALLFFATRRPLLRLWILIVSSLVFYAAWSVPLTSLIVLSAFIDHFASHAIVRTSDQTRRKLYLSLSLALNLGLLAYFKYANFFLDNLRAVLGEGSIGTALEVVLPPGISFYTFQTMSYTIDVYRRQITPTRSFSQMFLFVSFFPQLVAGPIERAGHLLAQFEQAVVARFRVENLAVGLRMIIFGLAKKVLVADHVARLVDPVYANPGAYDGWTLLVATYAFTLQIYFDFSAYSEIARGTARIFGVSLMRNFDQPYLAANPSDFWRRWHISLSTWFRDYVYLPLGGNRGTKRRALANLVITMFLSGLWHGAAWTFVIWGLGHGALLLVHALGRRTAGVARWVGRLPITTALVGWFVTLHAVVAGWVLFRAETIADAGLVLRSIAAAPVQAGVPGAAQTWFFAAFAGFLALSWLERRYRLLDRIAKDTATAVLFYGALVLTMLLFGADQSPAFIYFQF
jgi:alginate O-acetyltransferase complex protein AlgI